MKELEYFFRTELEFSVPVTEHVFMLRCIPAQDAVQRTQAVRVELSPSVPYTVQVDGLENWMVCGSIAAEHDRFVYQTSGVIRVDLSRRQKEVINPVFRMQTEQTKAGKRIEALWSALSLEGLSPRERAERLNQTAFSALQYCKGVTTTETTAEEAAERGAGVCQDYAHLLLSLARCAGFAARYCMGLLLGEGATHAWVEIALDEGWIGFDPTNGCAVDETYLRFAAGRDARDCCVEKGVFRGLACQTQRVEATLKIRA